MSDLPKTLLRILLPLIVLIFGIMVTRKLVSMRKAPNRAPSPVQIIPVEVIAVSGKNEPILVRASGTVIPAREVALRPQVSGRVISMNPALQPGSRFLEGEELLRIDPRDYELAVDRARANVEQARFEITQEKGRQAIALREWELLGKDGSASPEGRDLALRKPHLERAMAALKVAEASLQEAELALERTVIRAPFNALIKSESVEAGQLLTPQNLIANLTGTDQYWVQAALPVGELGMFQLPDRKGVAGASARIVHQAGNSAIQRQGRVVRLLGDLEEAGRLARVLVAVDQPFGNDEQLPLLMGAYVEVEIEGQVLQGIFSIPTQALREGDRVWIMNSDKKLEIRQVQVSRLEQERVLIGAGLAEGDRVITSRIGTPIPGMLLEEVSSNPVPDGEGSRE